MTAEHHAAALSAVARTLNAVQTLAATDASLRLEQQGEHILIWRDGAVLHRVPTPVHPSMLARLLSQAAEHRTPALLHGWRFDGTARQLLRNEQSHTLTEKEALLLGQLLSSYPTPCSREMLLRDVWGVQSDIETHTLETHIYRLRHKLGELSPRPCDIATVDGAYLLVLEPIV